MGLLSAGVAAGIGEQMVSDANQRQKAWDESDLMRERMAMQEQMGMRLSEHQEQTRRSGAKYDIENIDPLRSAAKLKEQGLIKQQDFDLTIANAEKAADSQIKVWEKTEPVKARLAADAELMKLTVQSTPEALAAARKIAAASKIYSPDEVAEGKIKEIQLANTELMTIMQGQYAEATRTGDKKAAQGIADVMIARFTTPSNKQDSATITAALKVYVDPMAEETEKAKAGQVLSRAFDKELGGSAPPPPGTQKPWEKHASSKTDSQQDRQLAPSTTTSTTTTSAASAVPAVANTPGMERRNNAIAIDKARRESARIQQAKEDEEEAARIQAATTSFRQRNPQY